MPAVIGLGLALAWLRHRDLVFRVEIRGDSMAPTLQPGDVAVAVATGAPSVGDVILLEHPRRPGFDLVKRVTAIPGGLTGSGDVLGSGTYWVEGDRAFRSTDSRHFGPVGVEHLRARVVVVVWPPSRLRWVRRGVRV